MQPKEEQSGPEISPEPQVEELPKEAATLPKENIPEERTYALLESEVHLQLIQPIYDALNGSGRIILQMERSGDIKDKKSGLIIAGTLI